MKQYTFFNDDYNSFSILPEDVITCSYNFASGRVVFSTYDDDLTRDEIGIMYEPTYALNWKDKKPKEVCDLLRKFFNRKLISLETDNEFIAFHHSVFHGVVTNGQLGFVYIEPKKKQSLMFTRDDLFKVHGTALTITNIVNERILQENESGV